MTIGTLPTWTLLAATLLAADLPREQLELSGTWEHQIVDELGAPPESGEWIAVKVPGYLSGTDYRRAWFRRSFMLPDSMREKRLTLHFGGVKYNSRVYLNGKHVGGCFGGYRPFEVDVTDAVRLDGPNQLAVGCSDWTGIFTPGRVDFSKKVDSIRLRGVPRDKILAPIGGLYQLYGIWDDVLLRAHPAVYIKDLFVKPSVRRGELVIDYVLANESDADVEVDLSAVVEDDGNAALELPSTRVDVPAGKEVHVTVRKHWRDPRFWSHVDPYLYHLRTELSTGDVKRTRFGFREFWTEGHHYYLNGTRVNLLATSWWPPHAPMSREEIRRRFTAIKQAGCVAFRTHTQPWRGDHYDVADELGLLMIIEGAVWNDENVYRINDPVFWENYAGHLRSMVDRDKNRPSVVMWSLENEFYGGRLNDEAPAKEDLIRMGRLVKKWDPTRPIFYESDGDPGGVADSIGIHYPHEYPNYTRWPNEADWLARPQEITHRFHDGEDEFFWRKNKPLYVGEFLWLPSADPSWHTVFFGDDAYRDYRRYRNLGKAESWKMQILGYRRHEVAGISPWTVIEGGPLDETNALYRAHQYAYQPIAAYCRDYDRRFRDGEKVVRHLDVFNDVMERSKLELSWTLIGRNPLVTSENEVIDSGRQELELGPAEHRMVNVMLSIGGIWRVEHFPERLPATWRLTLRREGEVVFEDTHEYVITSYVRPLRFGARFGLYDPEGTKRSLLAALPFRTEPVASLEDLGKDIEVLVIAPGALSFEQAEGPIIGRELPERGALIDFARRGGRVLVLEQEQYPSGLFNVGLTEQQSTMTFPARSDHPALEGIEPDDLKFWRGDHLVSTNELARPLSGGGMPIIVSGSAAGIDTTPLLEQPVGHGCIIHCQLRLIEKLNTEPIAARLLGNLLGYLADYQPAPRKTAVLGGSEAYRAYLHTLGLAFDELLVDTLPADLSNYSLIVCRDTIADTATLRKFVQRGGNVLVHRASPEVLEQLRKGFETDLVSQPYAGSVRRAEGDDPLLQAITREDVYWLGTHVGISWSETPRAAGMVDGVFSKTLDGKRPKAFEVEDWALSGQIVERCEPGVSFATTGSASAEVEFSADGTYVIGLVARGTVCDGVWPVARVSIDDEPLGLVPVGSEQWQTATTFGRVKAGRHQLSVAFINDGGNAERREDRNLYVDKVLVALDDNAGSASFLTDPPAVAVVRRGLGTLVVDQLRWDTEEPNARKAARYAGSLLASLGADFSPRLGVAVECEGMTPQGGIPHYQAYSTYASMACTGYIKTSIQVATAGRYTLRVVAAGSSAAGTYPIVAVEIDQQPIGQIELATGNWRPYLLEADLPKGMHELSLRFTNDENIGGEDRNLRLDKVVFYRE